MKLNHELLIMAVEDTIAKLKTIQKTENDKKVIHLLGCLVSNLKTNPDILPTDTGRVQYAFRPYIDGSTQIVTEAPFLDEDMKMSVSITPNQTYFIEFVKEMEVVAETPTIIGRLCSLIVDPMVNDPEYRGVRVIWSESSGKVFNDPTKTIVRVGECKVTVKGYYIDGILNKFNLEEENAK